MEGQKAEFCKTHASVEMINVKDKRCKFAGCSTRPTFGELFKDKTHCAQHKKENEYKKNKPKCESPKCKNIPVYTDKGNYPIRCEEHYNSLDINIMEAHCVSCGLLYMLNSKTLLCNDCDSFIEVKKSVRHYKEHVVKGILEDKNYKFIHDQIPNGSCDRYRPDFIIDCISYFIIVEVDENQHRTYECRCEQARMINIVQDVGGGLPVTFIRYNPDRYIDNMGKKIDARNKSTRHKILTEVIDSVILYKPENQFEVIYLFYDGHGSNNFRKDIVNINQIFESKEQSPIALTRPLI